MSCSYMHRLAAGFGVFGVSESNVNAVIRYVRNREAHQES